MTHTQEIAELKQKLDKLFDPEEQGKVLLQILAKYTYRNDTLYEPYLLRLEEISGTTGNKELLAWAFDYRARLNSLKGEHDMAINLVRKAIDIHTRLDNKAGMASGFTTLGMCCERQGNYPAALENHILSLQYRDLLGDKIGQSLCLNSMGVNYAKQGHYEQSLKSFFAGLKIQEEMGMEEAIAPSLNNIALIYKNQGKHTEALDNFYAALKIVEKLGKKDGIALCRNNIANVYRNQGRYPEALENLFASLAMREEIGDKHGVNSCYLNIGRIYGDQGKYPEALENFFIALSLSEELGDKQRIAANHANIGAIYNYQEKYAEALEQNLIALSINREIGNNEGVSIAYYNIGSNYYHQGKYSEALNNFFTALNLSEAIGQKEQIAAGLNHIARVYLKQDDHGLAGEMLTKALQLSTDIGMTEAQKDALQLLYELNKTLGHFQEALSYHEKFLDISKLLENEETGKKIAGLEFGYKIDKKEHEVKLEREKKEELQLAYNLLGKEKERSENLLLNILPVEVAEELKEKGTAEAKLFDEVTVLFTDFKDFTGHSERLSPTQLVAELHTCFRAFDEIIDAFGIEKIKTVGDAYLAVSGLPVANPNHAEVMIQAALRMQQFINTRIAQRITGADGLGKIRAGVHSGRVVAGIVGVKKFAYDIWGDTVNIAARMEQNGEEGRVNISQATYFLVKNKFNCTYRGKITAKNKGEIDMYFVVPNAF